MAFRLGGKRSIQLSYRGKILFNVLQQLLNPVEYRLSSCNLSISLDGEGVNLQSVNATAKIQHCIFYAKKLCLNDG